MSLKFTEAQHKEGGTFENVATYSDGNPSLCVKSLPNGRITGENLIAPLIASKYEPEREINITRVIFTLPNRITSVIMRLEHYYI